MKMDQLNEASEIWEIIKNLNCYEQVARFRGLQLGVEVQGSGVYS